MKLISMIDFVLEVVNTDRPCDRGKMLDEIANYAEFLKQPLTLEMFVSDNPLFENVKIKEFGRVVIETEFTEITIANTKIKKAIPNWTIETLVKDDVILTEYAIKQLGL